MKTFRIGHHDPAVIHAQLLAAGIPVITVRSSAAERGQSAMYGVVVTQDSANNGQVNSIINGHVHTKGSPPTRTANVVNAAQDEMSK